MSQATATPAPDLTTRTFEQNVNELETLVAKLERGELPLADSLQAFARGMALVQACETQLARTELEVQTVGQTAGATPAR